MSERAWWRLAAVAATALLVVVSYGFSNTKAQVDNRYRWEHEFAVVDTVDIKIRFPKRDTGSNAIPDSAGVVAGNARAVEFVQIANGGSSAADFIVFSPSFPAGKDTIRVTSNVRTFTVSGARVDSLTYLTGTAPDRLFIYAAGGL